MLREQGFVWGSWAGRSVLDDADLQQLDDEAKTAWRKRLGLLAERVIRARFTALGVDLDKDFFRVRRG
jgi:hypothetical protein